jgi:hypothetical protein
MTSRTAAEYYYINEARALRLVLARLREFEDGNPDANLDAMNTSTEAVFAETDRDDLEHIADIFADQIAGQCCADLDDDTPEHVFDERRAKEIRKLEDRIGLLIRWAAGEFKHHD